jgi:hypothetical protein
MPFGVPLDRSSPLSYQRRHQARAVHAQRRRRRLRRGARRWRVEELLQTRQRRRARVLPRRLTAIEKLRIVMLRFGTS